MANYEPMSRETHLKRGHCCKSVPWCVFCPYRTKPAPRTVNQAMIDRITAATLSGDSVTLFNDVKCLVSEETVGGKGDGQVRIVYKNGLLRPNTKNIRSDIERDLTLST